MLTKFYKVTEPKTLATIKDQLKLRDLACDSYFEMQEKFNAGFYRYTDSLRFGLRFGGLLFKSPDDFDHDLFKFSIDRSGNGHDYLCMPRKAKKKFYAEFMESIKEFSYCELLIILFNDKYANIGFVSKAPEAFYFTVKGANPVCDCIEITGSEYELASGSVKQEVSDAT